LSLAYGLSAAAAIRWIVVTLTVEGCLPLLHGRPFSHSRMAVKSVIVDSLRFTVAPFVGFADTFPNRGKVNFAAVDLADRGRVYGKTVSLF